MRLGSSSTMRRHAFWLASVWLLTGCISLSELRQSSPSRVGDVRGHYLPLATCVTARAQKDTASEGVSYEIQDIIAAKTARVVAMARFPGGLFYTVPTPLLELTLRETDDGNVKVEGRRGPLGSALELTIWPIIAECARGNITSAEP